MKQPAYSGNITRIFVITDTEVKECQQLNKPGKNHELSPKKFNY